MTRRRPSRPNPLDNFSFQATKHEILAEAELKNVAEVWLLKTEWELMWRMCGKLPVEPTPDSEDSFGFEARRFIKKDHGKLPEGILDRTTDDED